MPTEKPAVSFRLSLVAKDDLRWAAEKYGLSQAAVIELLLRMLRQGHLTIKPGQPKDKAKDEPPPRT